MSFIGDIIGSLTGTKQAAQAAQAAAATQAGAAQAGISAQQQQFQKIMEMMSPFVTAGTGALKGQQELLGLGGTETQQAAIDALQSSPQMQAMLTQGENAILQNASATGGLRGGNIEAALGQFRPQLLNQLIQQRFSNLGGLATLGQNTAAGVGNTGQSSAVNIANLLGQQGSALAGGQIAAGQQQGNLFGTLAGLGGMFFGAGGIPGIKKGLGF